MPIKPQPPPFKHQTEAADAKRHAGSAAGGRGRNAAHTIGALRLPALGVKRQAAAVVAPKNNKPKSALRSTMWALGIVVLLVFLVLAVWANQAVPRAKSKIDLGVSAGQGAAAIAKEMRDQGLWVNPFLFAVLAKVLFIERDLKAGRYEIPQDISTLDLMFLLSQGFSRLSSIALVEGQIADRLLARLRKRPDLYDDLKGLDGQAIARMWNLEGDHLEGWIYPDTYKYAPGSKLSDFLKRSIKLQKESLEKSWENRDPNLPIKSPYEALILASLVEKETARASDRGKVASVFVNRLRINMRLQTDPTVIYAVGSTFQGDITREHLRTDHPYNTYTRKGLPPTPIANPSRASLQAATRPDKTPYYYFVATGDGGSYFSKNLDEHNAAVRKYILGKK